jgi:hypothetical protein
MLINRPLLIRYYYSLLGRVCDLYTFSSLFPYWLANRLDTVVSPSFSLSLVPVPGCQIGCHQINPSTPCASAAVRPLRHLPKPLCTRRCNSRRWRVQYSRSRRFQTLHSQVAVNHRRLSRGSAFILVSQRRGDGPVMRASLGQFCHRATQSGRRAFILCLSNRRQEIADPTSKKNPFSR